MDYVRKRRWIKYRHIKCKMYLRNDFRFTCAYCQMREQDAGAVGENYFEKDHFVAKTSDSDHDPDLYDNMVYSCAKCNGTKSDKSVELLLDPCRDNIYSGPVPHVRKLGREGQYQLAGNTPEGWRYIESLSLNSKFYRELRRRQEQADQDSRELENVLHELSGRLEIPDELRERLEWFAGGNSPKQSDYFSDPVLRCGSSKAGQAFQEVLMILDSLAITYTLLFEEDDLDILIQYQGKEYRCEIVLNEKAVKQAEGIRVKKEQRECWSELTCDVGILYYYMRLGRLEFYEVGAETVLQTCLKK